MAGTPGLNRDLPPMASVCDDVDGPTYHPDAKVMLRRVQDVLDDQWRHGAACRNWYAGVRADYAQGL